MAHHAHIKFVSVPTKKEILMQKLLPLQQDFLAMAGKLRSIAQQAELGAPFAEKSTHLEEAMRAYELMIPVVGAFSSGKSTMLNTFLGASILPTSIKPETALATELRHTEEPFLEAVAEDGRTVRYRVDEIEAVSADAASWKHLRLWLNNARLKETEPLVLVDMPGFDAPLAQHNKAVMTYLLHGCHYLILCDIQEGTISQTLLRHMREMESWGRGFSLLMSKADLKPPQDVDEILARAREILSDNFDFPVSVTSLDRASMDTVAETIAKLNPDALFGQRHIAPMLELCNDMLDSINTRLKAARKDKDKLAAAIEELRESVKKIQTKADTDVETMRRTYSTGLVSDIVNEVGDALSASRDELISMVENGNQAQAEAQLNGIVRTALVDAVKDKMIKVNARICQDVSASLEGIDRILKENQFDEAYVQRLSLKIQTAFTTLQEWFTSAGKKAGLAAGLAGGGALGMGAKAVGGGMLASSLLGATAGIAIPVISIVLLFLPEILGVFFKHASKDNLRAALRSTLEGDIFPAVKRQLREVLPAYLEEQVERMIAQVREQYAELLTRKSEELEMAAAKQDADMATQERERKILETARDEVGAVLTSLCKAKKQWEQSNA